MQNLIAQLKSAGFTPDQICENEPMSRHTTMKVGGAADLLVKPASVAQIQSALSIAKELGVKSYVIGNGSNLIVRDGGIRGIVVQLGESFSTVKCDGTKIFAQAGAKLSAVAVCAQKNALTGLEFAHGIPGTVGGGVAMNAGAYGGELKDVIASVIVLSGEEIKTYSCSEMEFGYRTSRALHNREIVLSAAFSLTPGNGDEIISKMNELNARRRDKQPLNYPSSGSTFKRPEGHFAGALIEQCGLKGHLVGGAMVSAKHANFVVNTGVATADDVLTLIDEIKETVRVESGVALECEVRIIGEA